LLCKVRSTGSSYKIVFEPEYPADHPRMPSGYYHPIHSSSDGNTASGQDSRSENIVKDPVVTIVEDSANKQQLNANINDNIHKQRLNSISSPDLTSSYENI